MNVKIWDGDERPTFQVTKDERGRPHVFLGGEEVPPPCEFRITAHNTQDPLVTLDYGEGEVVGVMVSEVVIEGYKGLRRVKEERGET